MEIFAAVLIATYGGVMLSLLFGWLRLPQVNRSAHSALPSISVVIAARNEAANIKSLIQGLAAQTYPAGLWEVIIVDDDSEDQTYEKLVPEQERHLWLKVIRSTSSIGGKKASLMIAIEASVNEIICTTDADCLVPPDWLKLIAESFQTEGVQLVSGPVAYEANGGWLEKLQAVEFAGLIGAGAGCIALGKPTMCNGANLAFRRTAFNAVNGYSGNEQVASGDDEFLLHKIADKYGKAGYNFLKQPDATVLTSPKKSLPALLEQRVRWASKWPHYKRQSPRVLALFIGAIYVLQFGLIIAGISGIMSLSSVILLLILKTSVDLLFFVPLLTFFRIGRLWWAVLLLQLIYPVFVLIIGLSGFRKQYQWKSRTFSS